MTLIERLEGSERGSRELDALVWLHFNRPRSTAEFRAIKMRMWHDGRGHLILETSDGEEVADDLGINPVTTSLDAAKALAESVLPGWWWTAGQCGLTCHASVGPDRAFIAEPDLSRFDDGFHADIKNPSTPALALCAAILRAKEGAR